MSTIISALRSPGEQAVPQARIARVNRVHRRRIDDLIEDAFQHACMIGDLQTATELTDVLERTLTRWQRSHNNDRRNGAEQLKAMRAEILSRQQPRKDELELTDQPR